MPLSTFPSLVRYLFSFLALSRIQIPIFFGDACAKAPHLLESPIQSTCSVFLPDFFDIDFPAWRVPLSTLYLAVISQAAGPRLFA